MPVLYLTESEVEQVLTMEMAIEGVESGLRKMGIEEAFTNPRSRSQTDHVTLHVLPAAAKTLGVVGFKAYTTARTGNRFHVTLYDGKTGEMLALMQADHLGRMRTGAASAVATKHLAKADATTLGVCGTGGQAKTQVEAISKVRKLKQIRVWSPKAESRQRFAAEMADRCHVEAVPCDTSEEAVRGQDIVVTATSSREPILKGEWLSPGQHLNVIGSNFLSKAEIDVEAVRRADVVFIDSKDQGKLEAGDFVAALDQGAIEWYDVQELCRLVAGRTEGRTSPEQITLFKSLGIGLEDIAVGIRVFTKAKEAGVGKWLDL